MATRSAAAQGLAEQLMQANAFLIEGSDLRAALLAANSGRVDALTEDQQLQLRAFYSQAIAMERNRFTQIQTGVLSDEDLLSISGRGGVWLNPFFQERWWPERRSRYPQEFLVWFEERLAQ